MRQARLWTVTAPLVLLSTILLIITGSQAAAEDPERQTTITMPYTEYVWWLVNWADNQVVCEFVIEREGSPSEGEIRYYCGETIRQQFHDTSACPEANVKGGNTQNCQGLYLHLTSSTQKERQVVVDLPSPQVWLELANCDAPPPEYRCNQLPRLLITAEEPLPNEAIIAINGLLNGGPFSCAGDRCELPLKATQLGGVLLEVWAVSSYGDTSEHFTAKIRVLDAGVGTTPDENAYYVQVLSTQWRGSAIPNCAQVWQAFPPYGEPPKWLQTPDTVEALTTDVPYSFLAGRLITHGFVDASACPDGGLLPSGAASTCGLETARPLVNSWQNRFDTEILRIANDRRIPAFLLKNVFAHESQFWPGAFVELQETGLGQLSEAGADAALLWNRAFYKSFCPLVLDASTCQESYTQLKAENQAMLRGALMNYTDASCADCPSGLDLIDAMRSVEVFARMLLANCEQTGQVVSNTTGQLPGLSSSYEDLWRFTLANYQAGPGCLFDAITETRRSGEPLTWNAVALHFSDTCQSAIKYVDDVTHVP